MNVILLAAGYATRMHAITKGSPKQFLPLTADKNILDLMCEQLSEVKEIRNSILVTNEVYYETFKAWQKKGNSFLRILSDGTSSNETRLGAIGDINFVLERNPHFADDDLMIMSTDDYFPSLDLNDLYKTFKEKNLDTAVCVQHEKKEDVAKKKGVAVIDKNGIIIDIEEKPENPKSTLAPYFIYLVKKESVKKYYNYLEKTKNTRDKMEDKRNLLQYLSDLECDIYAYITKSFVCDVGSPESYEKSLNYFKSHV